MENVFKTRKVYQHCERCNRITSHEVIIEELYQDGKYINFVPHEIKCLECESGHGPYRVY